MNKVEQYIKRIESKGKQLSGYQKSLIYRCALMGITEEQMDLFVTSDYPVLKEELIIASIIDGLDTEYIRKEIADEDSTDRIRRKRADYLMENFRSNDEEYNQLREELIVLRTQAEDFSKMMGRQKKEYASLSREIQKKKDEIKQLKNKIKERSYADEKQTCEARREIETRIITKFKKPSGMKETIYCLLGKTDKLPVQREEVINDRQEFFDLIVDLDLNMEQMKEVEHAYLDGIEIETIKKIANKEFAPDRMKALRKMVCILNKRTYSETGHGNHDHYSDPVDELNSYEKAVDDCMVITDESVKGYEECLPGKISFSVRNIEDTESMK